MNTSDYFKTKDGFYLSLDLARQLLPCLEQDSVFSHFVQHFQDYFQDGGVERVLTVHNIIDLAHMSYLLKRDNTLPRVEL